MAGPGDSNRNISSTNAGICAGSSRSWARSSGSRARCRSAKTSYRGDHFNARDGEQQKDDCNHLDPAERKILVVDESLQQRPENAGRPLGIHPPGVQRGVQPLDEFKLGCPGGVADYCGPGQHSRPAVLWRQPAHREQRLAGVGVGEFGCITMPFGGDCVDQRRGPGVQGRSEGGQRFGTEERM